ncbi:MAG TPA: DMT family transporter [Acidimicrobiia bacterium]|jgi:drug/metabolite transporter (DMT)-like permease
MAVPLALLAAVAYALASVLQQRAAREVPESLSMRPGLLWRLFRRPLWLLGTVADWSGFGLQALALGLGSLIVVQPLLCTGLLFALPLGAAWEGRRLEGRDWVGAVAMSVGLAVFLVVGAPTEGRDFASTHAWIVAALVLVPVIAACTIAAMRTRNTPRAVLLALATTLIYSLTAVLTKSAVTELGEGLGAFVTSWEPYAGLAAGAVALLLNQSAFQAGALQASLPTLTAGEPVVGSLLGFLMLGELLTASGPLEWTLVVLSAVVTIAAVVVLSVSAARFEEEIDDEQARAG